MPKAHISYLSRGAIIALCMNLGACSLQPARDSKAIGNAGSPTRHRVRIGTEPDKPLPVVLLKSDPLKEDEPPVEQAHNIWKRVRDGFALASVDHDPRIAYYEAWYRSKPGYLHLVTGRAEPYLYFILEEIQRRHLPTELALLPIVESAYIPYAYSTSHAAGIWQFIPETGRLYGLKQDWWYDGRRDIYASTVAALDYLQALNRLLGGDWLNTLAAYNAGPKRVLGEIEDNRSVGKPTDFWHLDLPTETHNYIPKLLAVKALVQNPAKFGIKLWPVSDEPYMTAVDIDTQIDLALAAKLADMEVEPFQLLNPGFNRWATDPDGPHRLLLPIDRAEKFKLRLAKLPASARAAWLRHEIQSGETLSYLARRYGVSISELQQTNGLHGSLIRAGSELLVPQTSAAADVSSYMATQRMASRESEQGEPHTHVVKRGDSLWSIARSYDISVDELIGWNGRSLASIIKPGDQLIVRRTPDEIDARQTGPSSALRTIKYSVQSGDSLYAIARRFNVSVSDLCRWNNVQNNSLLYPGQAMTLYVDEAEPGGEG